MSIPPKPIDGDRDWSQLLWVSGYSKCRPGNISPWLLHIYLYIAISIIVRYRVLGFEESGVILNPVIKNWLFIPPFASCRSDLGVRLRTFGETSAWAQSNAQSSRVSFCRTLSQADGEASTVSSRSKPFAYPILICYLYSTDLVSGVRSQKLRFGCTSWDWETLYIAR